MATLDLLPADLQLVQTLLERSVDSVGGQGVDVKDHAMSILRAWVPAAAENDENSPPSEHQPAQSSQQQQQKQAPAAAVLDTQVADLQKRVQEQTARVQALRAEMPAFITQSVQGELRGLMPESEEQMASGTNAAEGAAPDARQPTSEEIEEREKTEELQALLSGSLDKMPGVRARLEQAVQRLTRITTAVDAEQSRNSPLKTVEKVLLDRPQDDTENIADQTASFADGSQTTRRRLAKDLNAKIL